MDIEWLILADSAQVVGNKLYLLGGGWDTLTVNTAFPVRQRVTIAASFRVPWTETNMKHAARIQVLTEDHQEVANAQIQIEVGRPVGLQAGTSQRYQVPLELNLELKAPGTFVVVAQVGEEEAARTSFRVQAGQSTRR
jgi:hypothetical protein